MEFTFGQTAKENMEDPLIVFSTGKSDFKMKNRLYNNNDTTTFFFTDIDITKYIWYY